MPRPKFAKEKVEKIQINEGIIYLDFGETSQKLLAPCRGGGEFTVERNIRDIDFDGKQGKTMGTRIIDEENANLKVTVLDISIETIKLALPGTTATATKISNKENGLIATTDYLKNVTMFAQVVGGGYKKITLYNAMADAGLKIAATPKSEGTIEMSFAAHWDISDAENKLYDIEDVADIVIGG